MRDALAVTLLSLLPRRAASHLMGRAAAHPLSRWLTRAFVLAYGVRLDEADPPQLSAYGSLDALFTRQLRPGARPVDPHPDRLVSPCDGKVGFVGTATGGQIRLHGREQALGPLVRRPVAPDAQALVIYLSPTDYHRVHSPLAGTATEVRYGPGDRWPVFPGAIARRPQLLPGNERVTVTIDSAHGPHEVCLVGAFGVGHITLDLPSAGAATGHDLDATGLTDPLTAGGALGAFHLGSTVVLVGPPGTWDFTVQAGDRVQMGAMVGSARATVVQG